jgi:hypothetical protein
MILPAKRVNIGSADKITASSASRSEIMAVQIE